MSSPASPKAQSVPLTYTFLLIFSTALTIFFCWLYLNKSTEVTTTESQHILQSTSSTASNNSELHANTVVEQITSSTATDEAFSLPSENSLPGEDLLSTAATIQAANAKSAQSSISPDTAPSTESMFGWEETNDRIQHKLEAQYGEKSERITIDVPVIYKTRGMRLGPEEALEAQRILRALKIYQQQIDKLQKDGENIKAAWNDLLMRSQPIEALKTDSPSLPQVTTPSADILIENSSETINVETNE